MISLASPSRVKNDFELAMLHRRQFENERLLRQEAEAAGATLKARCRASEEEAQQLRERLAGLEKTNARLTEINRELERENRRLGKMLSLRYGTEGYFGSSTPSSKRPPQPNSPEEKRSKKGGAVPGHPGHGRKKVPPEKIEETVTLGELPERCDCGGKVNRNGYDERTVVDYIPARTIVRKIRTAKADCQGCGKHFTAPYTEAAPRAKYSNRLLARAAVEHYFYGHSLGETARRFGLSEGVLLHAFHAWADSWAPAIDQLVLLCREETVIHADETVWKCDGASGYAWLFASARVTICCHAHSRGGEIAAAVFGDEPLPGVLCVDRYAAYNKIKVRIQYCYAHLKRSLDDLLKEFPDDTEIAAFVNALSPLLARAMSLRSQGLGLGTFLEQASGIKQKIISHTGAAANHPAIQNFQNIFRQNPERLYHWAESPDVPADNNYAERSFRPEVIARKISFGSQSDRGRRTRSVIASILLTAAKNGHDPGTVLETLLRKTQAGQNIDLLSILL